MLPGRLKINRIRPKALRFLLVVLAAAPALGQGQAAAGSRAMTLLSSSARGGNSLAGLARLDLDLPASARPDGEILREIDDPSSGQRWLLMRDDSHPGGPGLLLRAGGGQPAASPAQPALASNAAPPAQADPRAQAAAQTQTAPQARNLPQAQTLSQAQTEPPVIRSGDHLVIEEDTPTVAARLEAVALTAAWPGSSFNARLAIGGRVVAAVALGPGRAAFQPQPPQPQSPQQEAQAR
jgi:hypothetical protein